MLIGKELTRLVLGGPKTNLKVYIEALTGHVYRPMVSTTHYFLKVAFLESSYSGNSRRSEHSKDRGWGEEPLSAQVQLKVQPVVTSSLSFPLMSTNPIHEDFTLMT